MNDHESTTAEGFDAAWRAAFEQPAARAAWAMLKLTAAGDRPVGVDRLGEAIGLSPGDALGLVREYLDIEERDGMVHLNLGSTGTPRYHVQIGDRALDTDGCAVDVFLLALATGAPVSAESACPATGTPIRVDLTPEEANRVEPATTVVAVLDIAEVGQPGGGPEQVDEAVCSQQPFFASTDAAATWLARHPGGRVFRVAEFLERTRRDVAVLEARRPDKDEGPDDPYRRTADGRGRLEHP